MTTRVKTVQYAWESTTANLADANWADLGTITVYLPETSSRDIKSAFIEWSFRDSATSAQTITDWRVELTVGASVDTHQETDDFANTGENLGGVVGPVDFTSHIDTNFGAGASQTMKCRVYMDASSGAGGWTGIGAVLTITYEYDDDAATQVKTVWLPLEGQVGPLGVLGSAPLDELPQLTGVGGILPENTPVIRNAWVQLEGNNCAAGSNTDISLSVALDGGPATTWFVEMALASDVFGRYIYDVTGSTFSAAQDLEVWASVARFHNLTAVLVVTYEFTLSGTTRTLNSLILPVEFTSPIGGTAAADASYFEREFYIEEPGAITVRNSAFRLNYIENGNIGNLYLRSGDGTQTFGSAMATAATQVCGMFSAQRRCDSSLTLARGANTLMASAYRTGGNEGTNANGVLYINYESGVSTEGIGAHNHVVLFLLDEFNGALGDLRVVPSFTPSLPETSRFISAISVLVCYWVQMSGGGITLDAELGVGEGKGDGWQNVYTDVQRADNERGCSLTWMRARPQFRRWSGDPDSSRMGVETGRRWRFFTTTTSGQGMVMLIAYHAITFTVAGTVSGYDGDGSGIPVDVFRAHNDEKVLELTTTTGGSFSGTWYDDTQPLYCVAREDDTHVGRSANAVAT